MRTECGNLRQVVCALLGAGADPYDGLDCAGTPLIIAARLGHLKIVEALLYRIHGSAEDDLLCVAPGNWPYGEPFELDEALYAAAAEGHAAVVQLLLFWGAQDRAQSEDDYGWVQGRPLNVAAWRGQLEVVELLAEHGEDFAFDNPDPWLRTPLTETSRWSRSSWMPEPTQAWKTTKAAHRPNPLSMRSALRPQTTSGNACIPSSHPSPTKRRDRHRAPTTSSESDRTSFPRCSHQRPARTTRLLLGPA